MTGGLGGTLPIQGTGFAGSWDDLYYFLFWVCVVFFAIVIIPMLVFVIKYRERPGIKPASHISHNIVLEFVWTVIPTIVSIVIFAWGWAVYKESTMVPANAMEIRVIAKSWAWTFQYDDGRTTTNELFVPVNTPIRLTITSEKNDVLHSFYVPNFRIKKDAVPGMFSTLWFNTPIVGQHILFCAEYCGADHSNMTGKVIALKPEDFEKWKWGAAIEMPPPIGLPFVDRMATTSTAPVDVKTAKVDLVKHGQKLASQLGCDSCHSDNGSKMIGPSYKGLFGRKVELADGSIVLADENWIREKIETPQKRTVKGYEGLLMPSYLGQLNEQELNAMIAYIKTLN